MIYEQTKNLFTLQILLGHSKPGLTDYYWFSAEFTLVSEAEWAAAGSVDTDLSFLSLLELYGTEIAERRMPTPRVVEALDVVEHI